MSDSAVTIESAPVPISEHETAASAVATQARALVEARFTMALARPRSVDDARQRILADCKRPRFAEVAIYSLPRGGKKIEGPSIRFVEAALRSWGNADSQAQVLYEDDDKMIVRVTVTDLETNATYASEHRVSKTIERKQLARNQKSLGERTNSFGDTVYIVRATDDDLAMKLNALVSRAIRTNGLRLLPGDIVEEAMEQVRKTQQDKAAADPDAERKKIADAFAPLGVTPSMLQDDLGHPLAQSTPTELVELRAVYAGLRDGETTWKALVEQREGANDDARNKEALDEKDVAKVRKIAEARAKELGDESITADTVLAECMRGDESKADLPGLLKALAGWNPPA